MATFCIETAETSVKMYPCLADESRNVLRLVLEGEVIFFERPPEIPGEKMHAFGHTSLSSTLKEQVPSRFGTSLTCKKVAGTCGAGEKC